MSLGDLAEALEPTVGAAGEISVDADLQVGALAYDSRAVGPGTLFFCVPGFAADGHDFAPAAVQAGAVALVVERPLGLGVPELVVPSVRAAMAPIAGRFYGRPSHSLDVVGVTGTNGKTTTTYLVRHLLESCGRRCGLLGTVKSVIGGSERPVARTTPEALDLQRDLRAMLDGGDRACAIEVSSHALELGRTDAVAFAVATFTNITRDHLDFHPTMEDYFLAKRRLFRPERGPAPGACVINVGDPYGLRLTEELGDSVRTYAVGASAEYEARDVRQYLDGCRFELCTPAGSRRMWLAMPGAFNVANALAALASAHALGLDLDELVGALEDGVRVPGRFEPVDEGQDFAVLVDYAHTPDSLENVLGAAREVAGSGRVICVFGAGGDRDRGKRPLMGEIAARLTDVAIVTSDNPRSEEPASIVAEILAGIAPNAREQARVVTDVDRRAAIEHAVALASGGDVLVIAGKGHEQGQELAGGRKVPFDDATVAREALAARRATAGTA